MKNNLKAFIPLGIGIIGLIPVILLEYFKIVPEIASLKGIEDVISLVNDFSIAMIGIYTSLIAIIAALDNSSIMKRIKKSTIAMKELHWRLGFSISCAFLSIIISGLMLLRVNIDNLIILHILSSLWLLFIFTLLVSVFLTTILMLRIIATPNKPKHSLDS
ncbi:hypothetical protein LLWA12L8_FAMOGCFE_00817 [Lactococcus lactis]|uniref:hypothetical protein n=1 Tax=Lactococcus lactis TaxID=1358 RepID=UPI00384E8CDC